MDSQKWDKIQNLFHHCIELSLDEQVTLFENLEENDPEIIAELKKLLDAHHASGTFLEDEILRGAIYFRGRSCGALAYHSGDWPRWYEFSFSGLESRRTI